MCGKKKPRMPDGFFKVYQVSNSDVCLIIARSSMQHAKPIVSLLIFLDFAHRIQKGFLHYGIFFTLQLRR